MTTASRPRSVGSPVPCAVLSVVSVLSVTCLLAVALMFVSVASAQEPGTTAISQPPARFVHLDIDDGLSTNRVHAVHRTADGVMWFGTQNGLNLYDGTTIELVSTTGGGRVDGDLGDRLIGSIAGSGDTLWLGMIPGGLVRFDRATGQSITFEHDPDDPSSLPDPTDTVESVAVHGDDVWVGTAAGLARLDATDNRFTSIDAISGEVSALAIDDADNGDADTLWVGTTGDGAYAVDLTTGEIRDHYTDTVLASNSVTAIAIDAESTVWIGTARSGVNAIRADGSIESFRRAEGEDIDYFVIDLAVAPDGRIWMAVSDRLYALDPATGRAETHRHDGLDPDSLAFGTTTSVYVDPSGLVWIGKLNSGVDRFDPGQLPARLLRVPPGSELGSGVNTIRDVSVLTTPGHDLVAVSTLAGLGVWDVEHAEFTYLSLCRRHAPAPGGGLWCIRNEEQGIDLGPLLYLDFSDGLPAMTTRFDPPLEEAIGRPTVITPDRRGGAWIGGTGVVHVTANGDIDRVVEQLDGEVALPDSLSSLLVIDDTVWASSFTQGVVRIDLATGDRTAFGSDAAADAPTRLSDMSVSRLAAGPDGAVLISTAGGLDVYHPGDDGTDRIERYDDTSGLASRSITTAALDTGGDAWVATPAGLSRIGDLADTTPATAFVTTYTADDGLSGLDFSEADIDVAADGRVFVGSPRGLNVIDPTLSRPAGCSEPPVLGLARFDGEPVTVSGGELAVPPDVERVDITFEHHCYRRSSLSQIRYRTAHDQPWTVLPPGAMLLTVPLAGPRTIDLDVQASDRVGGWIGDVLAVTFDIEPHWWERGIARVLAAALAVAVIALAWLWRQRRLLAANRRLAAEVDARSADLRAANAELTAALENQRNTLDVVAHDLRSPLMRQMACLGLMGSNPQFVDSRILQREATKMDRIVSRILFARGSEELAGPQMGPVSLSTALDQTLTYLTATAAAKDITFDLEHLDGDLEVHGDPSWIDQVLDNLLDNAIKYSFRGGVVEVRTSRVDDTQAQVVITDAGIGVDDADRPLLFTKFGRGSRETTAGEPSMGLGLFGVQRMMRAMNGDVELRSDGADPGSTVECRWQLADAVLTPTTD